MNHSRDENGMGATSRRAVTSSGAFQAQVPPNSQNQVQAAAQAPSQPQSASQGGVRRSTLTTNDALVYLREVKQRFQGRKDVYDSFLDVMKDFKAQRIDISTVIRKVKELLQGHNDLILGFNTFLPRGSEITLSPERREAKPVVELDQAITYINKIKARFANDECVYKNFLEILCCFRQGRMDIHSVYREVADLFHSHEDLLEEFGYFLPDHSQEGAAAQELLSTSARAMGAPLSLQSNTIDGAGDAPMAPRRRSSRGGGTTGRGGGSWEQVDYERERRFFAEVNAKLNNKETYTELLKCVNLYAQDVISKSELVDLVQDVIGKYPDVMATFRQFVGYSSHGMDEDGIGEDSGAVRDGHRGTTGQTQRNRAVMAQRNKYLTHPVSELDTSTLERPTTSYVRLPRDYPIMKCSGRTPEAAAILQDELASVTTGTEDGSFKHMRKNQYEENLFRCEDERYDFEMAIERNISALKVLRPIQDKLMSMSPEEKNAYTLPEGYLSAVHCRIIERIYGDRGKNVVELLKKNPSVAVSVVVPRLEQKDREWRIVRDAMKEHWTTVYQANYRKSLDHRSFYFKQSDKKNLSPKQLLLEIKEAADKANNEDQRLKNLTAHTTLSSNLQPHMSFNYSDPNVHEDVYQVVKFAARKMLSAEAYKQAMEFWVTFVEPFFRIAAHELEPAQSMSMEEDDDMATRHEDRDEEMAEDYPEVKDEGNNYTSVPNTPLSMNKDALDGAEIHDKNTTESVPMIVDPSEDPDGKDFDDNPKMGSSDDQSEPHRLFGGCQPLVAIMHESAKREDNPAGPSADHRSSGPKEKPGVFYCNEHFYIFLRLHQFLYDRLWMARKCSRSQDKQVEGGDMGEPSQLDEESADKVHDQFMSMVYQLIEGTMEMSQFEDRCRSLLSTNSYVLFTLDKLIFRTIKHMQALVQDEISLRIWDLYKYECDRLEQLEELYLSNCKVVLRDDQMFRIEQIEGKIMTIQAMSHEIMTEMGWHSLVKPTFNDYYKDFLGNCPADAMALSDGLTPVLLYRNLPSIQTEDGGEAEADHLSQYFIENGLEGRMHCDTSKLVYVLGSEDVLVRKRRRGNPEAIEMSRTRRSQNFRSWLQSLGAPLLDSVCQTNPGSSFNPIANASAVRYWAK